ncbi:MAG: LarC family nickel insertion protein, partial [Clostridiales Family XIII bacterium]|nr:LarC family nickel insertion protein [Clostridiales Family XIII bacterium]
MGLLKEDACREQVLYFECGAGISGDMALGALIHLGADTETIKAELSGLAIAPFNLIPNITGRSGVSGVDLDVIIYDEPQHDHDYYAASGVRDDGNERQYPSDHDLENLMANRSEPDEHAHTTYRRIMALIEESSLSANVKRMSKDIFTVIGRAEASVHGKRLEDVAFHEVGAMDSILDIVGTAIAVELLGVKRILCGPVHDGQGFIECQHGVIPVPVPAVMEMLKHSDIPLIIETDVRT